MTSLTFCLEKVSEHLLKTSTFGFKPEFNIDEVLLYLYTYILINEVEFNIDLELPLTPNCQHRFLESLVSFLS